MQTAPPHPPRHPTVLKLQPATLHLLAPSGCSGKHISRATLAGAGNSARAGRSWKSSLGSGARECCKPMWTSANSCAGHLRMYHLSASHEMRGSLSHCSLQALPTLAAGCISCPSCTGRSCLLAASRCYCALSASCTSCVHCPWMLGMWLRVRCFTCSSNDSGSREGSTGAAAGVGGY